jgi:hypothetical protein
MSFVTLAALGIALLVVAPVLAHLLRRRPPEERPFAAVALVPERTAVAQRRTALEDRWLLGVRAAAVVLLALLGATPLLRCARLSLARPSGASVALVVVVDDSLSMRAPLRGAPPGSEPTRFERARAAARELGTTLEGGDVVAVVLAGRPARVALGATTNMEAVVDTLAALRQSDRATDLEGALELADNLLRELEHVDKRIVLLSDLADGQPDAPPLRAPEGVTLWAPLESLREAVPDCGVVSADRSEGRVRVRVACAGLGADGAALRVRVRDAARVVVEAPIRVSREPVEALLALPEGTGPAELVAALGAPGGEPYRDAVGEDDAAPVVTLGGELGVGVVGDPAATRVATGGPPPVEQALGALGFGVRITPLAGVPDRVEELAPFGVCVVDDVPGLTPEQRRAVERWVEQGGVWLASLGPRAAAAPLGASFAPMLPALVRWARAPAEGIDRATDAMFLDAGEGMDRLAALGRAELELGALDGIEVATRWKDGAPFLLSRRLGRGVAYAVTLPFATEHSDLALRPGFLALLARMVETARSLGGATRVPVGASWPVSGFREVRARHVRVTPAGEEPGEPVAVEASGGGRRITPDRIGVYEIELDGARVRRAAALDERELDLRPRALAAGAGAEARTLGGTVARVDVSAKVALALLVLMVLELGLRVATRRGQPSLRDGT